MGSSPADRRQRRTMRWAPQHRRLFQQVMPRYMCHEIDPAMAHLDRSLIRRRSLTMFDVGANLGVWSGALLQHSGRFIDRLHLFEPLPGNLERIDAHRQLGLYDPFDDTVVVNPVAVSNEAGSVVLNTDGDVSGYASVAVKETLMGPRRVALDRQVEVEAITLDHYCERNDIERVHLLKIDVEGLEMPVLQGARRMLSEHRIDLVLYEFGTHQMGRRELYRDFWTMFDDLGYSSHRLRGHHPTLPVPEYTNNMEDFTKVRLLLAVRPTT